jgi:hypothetical protein
MYWVSELPPGLCSPLSAFLADNDGTFDAKPSKEDQQKISASQETRCLSPS